MKFKLKLFPRGRREWLWMLLQLILFFVLFTVARLYVTSMPGHSHTGPLQPLSDDEASLRDRLKTHVAELAGVMITDTAIFRYKHYHKLADTPDKLDYDRMSRVVAGLAHVLAGLGSD